MDIVKIASETIEGLFNMRLALPVALVRALTEGLDEVLRKYVTLTLSLHVAQGNFQCHEKQKLQLSLLTLLLSLKSHFQPAVQSSSPVCLSESCVPSCMLTSCMTTFCM